MSASKSSSKSITGFEYLLPAFFFDPDLLRSGHKKSAVRRRDDLVVGGMKSEIIAPPHMMD
ncbi:hypothetical protein COLO4_30850 [Corchorus olitorius]|uniref:Uncharacterized protein n=1 Tax=Corchorus olitorius TaxID=93759 RepID=A0A1R3H6K7_9ROSI|nr:hypothetical protein COLO4_30850 [Corchorus olitorius]